MKKYTILYEDYAARNSTCRKLLKDVKNGDLVTYLECQGESGDKFNLSLVWLDELDRPQKFNR